jgi:hypothetical protein
VRVWSEACLVQAQTENLSPIRPSGCNQEGTGLPYLEKKNHWSGTGSFTFTPAHPMPELCAM